MKGDPQTGNWGRNLATAEVGDLYDTNKRNRFGSFPLHTVKLMRWLTIFFSWELETEICKLRIGIEMYSDDWDIIFSLALKIMSMNCIVIRRETILPTFLIYMPISDSLSMYSTVQWNSCARRDLWLSTISFIDAFVICIMIDALCASICCPVNQTWIWRGNWITSIESQYIHKTVVTYTEYFSSLLRQFLNTLEAMMSIRDYWH